MGLGHRRRGLVAGTVRGQPEGGGAEVAGAAIRGLDLLLVLAVGDPDRVQEQPLAEPDLDRNEERRQAALHEVGERLDLVLRAARVDLGEDANQVGAFGRRLQLVQVLRQLVESHARIVLAPPRRV